MRRSWSACNPGNQAIRDELVRNVLELSRSHLRTARAILDAGCGTGWWLQRLVDDPAVTARLHGLELLPERASAARRNASEAIIDIGDVRATPYGDGAFDVLSLFTVLSSLSDDTDVRTTLTECRRVLAPGGVLLIWEPRLPNPANRTRLTIGRALLEEALGGMRLEERRLTLLPPVARRLGRLTPALYPQLSRLPLLRTHRLLAATQARLDA